MIGDIRRALVSVLAILVAFLPAAPAHPLWERLATGQEHSPACVTLRKGTEVHLRFAQTLRSQNAFEGQTVELALEEDLKAGDAVVARKGARVLGTIVEGKPPEEERGHARHLVLRVDVLRVGGRNIPLRGTHETDGKRNKDAMVAGTILLGLAGLMLTSGKKFTIPEGTQLVAWVSEDVDLPVLP